MKNSLSNRKIKTSAMGFSLIEVLVSLALFTVVVTMAVGTLLILIDANAKAQNTQSIMTNLSYTLDSMTRDIRTGYYYECRGSAGTLDFSVNSTTVANCSPAAGTTNKFAFTETGGSLTGSSGSHRIGYQLNTATGAIERKLKNTGSWESVTSPDVVITQLQFTVSGTTSKDDFTPTVTIYITGYAAGTANTQETFSLQTTIAQQALDI